MLQAKILSRYIVEEVVPQFISTLIILCTILIVSQLIRLSDMLATIGFSLENIFLPLLYIMLPFMSFNIPIAFLGAVLVSYGRLSSDGEYPAMLAAGFSLVRSAIPVFVMAIFLYVVAALCASYLEPWGRRELTAFFHRKTQTELDNLIKVKMQSGVFLEDFLGYTFYAEKISDDRTRFENVMIAPKNAAAGKSYFILAPTANLIGSVNEGNLRMVLNQGLVRSFNRETRDSSVMKFQRSELDLLKMFSNQILGGEELAYDYRSYPPGDLYKYVTELQKDPKRDDQIYWRARYLLHQRIGNPFAVIVFAFFGLVLGVSDPRKGKNISYIYAILSIIFGYVVIMLFQSLAIKGAIPAPIAAWLPNLILFSAGIFLLYQKNRLPPSESVLDPVHIPLFNRWYVKKRGKQ